MIPNALTNVNKYDFIVKCFQNYAEINLHINSSSMHISVALHSV